MFVGYCHNSKAYRVINPETKGLVISRDIKFDEGKGWDQKDDWVQCYTDEDTYGKKSARSGGSFRIIY